MWISSLESGGGAAERSSSSDGWGSTPLTTRGKRKPMSQLTSSPRSARSGGYRPRQRRAHSVRSRRLWRSALSGGAEMARALTTAPCRRSGQRATSSRLWAAGRWAAARWASGCGRGSASTWRTVTAWSSTWATRCRELGVAAAPRALSRTLTTGWRRHLASPPPPSPYPLPLNPIPLNRSLLPSPSLYGVWDGHGGIEAAEFASDALPAQLARQPELARPWTATGAQADAEGAPAAESAGGGGGCVGRCAGRGGGRGEAGADGVPGVLARVLRAVDDAFLEIAQREAHRSGTTALCALRRREERSGREELLVLNLGDSRAVLARAPLPPRAAPSGRALRREPPLEAVRLSCDHTPLSP